MKKHVLLFAIYCLSLLLVLAACSFPSLPASNPIIDPVLSDIPEPTALPETTEVPEGNSAPSVTTAPEPVQSVAQFPQEEAVTTCAVPETPDLPQTTAEPETTAAPAAVAEPLDLTKTIFLTFDDGPSRGKTEEVLHILDEYGICATFFTVGLFVDYYPDLTRQIVDSGHVLACHSYSHDYAKLYVSAETILSDLAAWEQAVTRAVGEAPTTRLYRFPGGTTSYSLTKNEAYPELLEAIVQAGYRPYDWTVATNDRYLAAKREEQTMEEFFLESLAFTLSLTRRTPAPPKILLMHDTSADTVETLPAVLDYLLAEGYTFATLDALNEAYIVNQP